MNRWDHAKIASAIDTVALLLRLQEHAGGYVRLSLSQVQAVDVLMCKVGEPSSIDDLDGPPQGPAPYGIEGVYVIEAGGRYKIGYSRDVHKRVRTMQTGCPFEMKVMTVIESTQFGESWLHQKLAKYRVCGEWFDLPEKTVRFLVSLRRPSAPPERVALWAALSA